MPPLQEVQTQMFGRVLRSQLPLALRDNEKEAFGELPT